MVIQMAIRRPQPVLSLQSKNWKDLSSPLEELKFGYGSRTSGLLIIHRASMGVLQGPREDSGREWEEEEGLTLERTTPFFSGMSTMAVW